LVLPAANLADAAVQKRFQEELGRGDCERIDLFCRDTSRAWDRVQGALRATGVRLTVDALAQEAARRKLHSHYLIVCDEMAAADWGQLMQDLAKLDRTSGENIFEQVVVMPADSVDQKELAMIFGSELTQPRGRANIRRPEGKKDGKTAFAAIIYPWRTPATSKEVRQYLDGRYDRNAGSPAVVLALRMVSGS
jgi:hypothetical protein